MSTLLYLDTGEIFETDEDGDPVGDPVVVLNHGVLDDDAHALGAMMAAAPELLRDCKRLVELLEQAGIALGPHGWCAIARDTIARAEQVQS
jgi:hypothetical protein